ncbi:hypothetical protein HLB23_27565 [Nocardia uniformis]|uniref:Uncharacterized protein n=1 Tax=Nocardia uniformis TaxID=53432 RepID=A0A849CB69_9NOCA|nr:hypothetical protein [Nocardia uniformis]NNH73570.1 hypothetical protein [Nocardia uniformis]
MRGTRSVALVGSLLLVSVATGRHAWWRVVFVATVRDQPLRQAIDLAAVARGRRGQYDDLGYHANVPE